MTANRLVAALVIVVASTTLILSCKKLVVDPNAATSNLIQNSTFEVAGDSSRQNWLLPRYAIFEGDTPPGGGNWSLQMYPGWMAPSVAQTFVTGISGTHIFRLSAWIKTANGWQGTLILHSVSGGIR